MFQKFLISLICIAFLFGCATAEPVQSSTPDPVAPSEPVDPWARINVFNGKITEDPYPEAVAVMIGNTSHARPQSGLSLADVVYEISVETMTITRYMAIFSSEFPTKVGPIRSVRIPFLTMLDEWDVGIAHFGGAGVGQGDALSLLESMYIPIRYDGVLQVNPEYFYRDPARPAPHNAYMNLQEASKDLPDMWPRRHFAFNPEPIYIGNEVNQIKIRYIGDNLDGYTYDPSLMRYKKSLNGEPHIDAYTDKQILVTNIVVQYAKHKMVEKAQYVLVDFFYSGDADYFIGGQHIKGRWVKDYPDDTTHYLDEAGNEIQFLPGNTWIHVIPDPDQVTFK